MAERKKMSDDKREVAEAQRNQAPKAAVGNKKSDTSAEKGDKRIKENKALVAVDAPKGAAKKGAKASNLPVADGGHAVGPGSVPIRMTQEERRNLLGRIGVLLLIAAVLALSVLIFILRPTAYTERTHSVVFLYDPARDVTLVVADGELEGDEGGYQGKLTYRADNGKGDVCAAIIGGALYVVDGNDVEKADDGVTDCVLSANGDRVAWRNAAGMLYYADVDDLEGRRCAAENAPNDRYCLSPDGRELFYTIMGGDGVSRMTLISLSGRSLIFPEDQNLTPVAVADNSKFLYYADANGALYVLNGETLEKTLCAKQPKELVFNADLSELLLQSEVGTVCFVDGVQFGINDLGAADRLELIPNRRVSVLPLLGNAGDHCLTESILDQYYIFSSGSTQMLVHLTEEKERGCMNEVAYGVEDVVVTDKYVFFRQTVAGTDPHTDLFCVENGDTAVEFCYGYVSAYCPNVDGSRLTYVTQTGLYSGRAKEMMEWISDHILRERGVEVSCDDAFYYFESAGKLFVSDNGAKAREVAGDVDWFFVDGDVLYYGVGFADDGVGTVFSNFRNSRKSDKLIDGVSAVG